MHDSDDDFNYDDFIKSIDFNISDCAFIAKNGTDWDCYYDDYFDDAYFYYDDYFYRDKTPADYVLIAILGVATVISVVVIVALLIPLFIQLKNGTFYQERNSRRSEREPPYSTYNLYLVYSALVDLTFLTSQFLYEFSLFYSVILSALAANLWINTVIVYEVLALLRASKNGRRITQPSLMKVNLQGGAIIAVVILLEVLVHVNFWGWMWYIFYCLYIFPIPYAVGVTIFVKCKALLPPSNGTTPRDKAVRGLALFFFRVILIFLVIWIPFLVLLMLEHYWEFLGGKFLIALQPILNFCLILSKPDVRKYITDLVTLTYIFGESSCCSCNCICFKDEKKDGNANQGHGQRTTRTSILGYTFEDASDDDNGNAIGSDSDAEEVDGDNNNLTIEDANDGNSQDEEVGIQQ